jgi:hypothetical protein
LVIVWFQTGWFTTAVAPAVVVVVCAIVIADNGIAVVYDLLAGGAVVSHVA